MAILGLTARLFAILSVFVELIGCQPNSPCPRIFQYIYNGQEWQGTINVNSLPMGVTMNLVVVLMVPQKINNEILGSLELWATRDETLERIANQQRVRYRVKFPPNTPMPKVSSIIYNGDRICTHKPNNYLEGLLVTQIRLEHKLYTKLAKERLSGEKHDRIAPRNPEVVLQNRFSTTSTTECGRIEPKFTITNLMMYGNEMERGSWPWLVALHAYKSTNLSFICGGTLISERIIISAAHCFHNREEPLYPPQDVIAFLGKHSLRKLTERGAVIAEITSIHIHPDFRRNNGGAFDADIAVLVMHKSVEFGDFIQPACLRHSQDLPSSRMGVIVGWGRDEHNNLLTYEPRRLEIPIVSEAECLAAGKVFSIITTPRTFCGGWRDGKRGPCHGDSGSGLLIYEQNKWQLAGIISIAVKHPISGLCDLNQYVVFTDVSKFVDWIEKF